MKRKISILIIALTGWMNLLQAQYEIRTVNKGQGIIGVEMRAVNAPAPAAGDYVTDMVFGIKWQSQYDVNLLSEASTVYNVRKSGGRQEKNGMHYQAFYADPIGFTIPSAWQLNEWVEVLAISNTRTSVGTGVFEICEPGFDPTTEPNFALNFNDFTPVINGNATGVILPVEISFFEARANGKNIQLNWTTQKEVNNKGFEIQRYNPETGDYKTIGWINGNGTNPNGANYTFTDDKVLANILYLYRLKQFDVDGRFYLSNIQSAKVVQAVVEIFKISPNPASTVLNLLMQGQGITGRVLVKITDTRGALVHSQQEVFATGRLIPISVAKLAAAQYILYIEQGDKVIYQANFQKE